jgi:hypothetical protein
MKDVRAAAYSINPASRNGSSTPFCSLAFQVQAAAVGIFVVLCQGGNEFRSSFAPFRAALPLLLRLRASSLGFGAMPEVSEPLFEGYDGGMSRLNQKGPHRGHVGRPLRLVIRQGIGWYNYL